MTGKRQQRLGSLGLGNEGGPSVIKVCYAYRRSVFYPYQGGEFPPASEAALVRARTWKRSKPSGSTASSYRPRSPRATRQRSSTSLRRVLRDLDLPCAAVRGGGGMHDPRVAAANRRAARERRALCRRDRVPMCSTLPSRRLRAIRAGPGSFVGDPVSQGSSRLASSSDFERSADGLREVADIAADLGLRISIEVHQHSIADCSWADPPSDRPRLIAPTSVPTLIWATSTGLYDTPDETTEAAIVALAPRAMYMHCKNLVRVHIPELRHSIFLRVPLPDGDIDYRFAITAMHDAGFDGYLAVEGARDGDQLTSDARSLAYVREILAELG